LNFGATDEGYSRNTPFALTYISSFLSRSILVQLKEEVISTV